jgi:hypothetical protein
MQQEDIAVTAISNGDIAAFQKLVAEGFDLNKTYQSIGPVWKDLGSQYENAYRIPSYKYWEQKYAHYCDSTEYEVDKKAKKPYGNIIAWTPLMAATARNNVRLVYWMIQNGAVLNIRDATGRTAEEIAQKLYLTYFVWPVFVSNSFKIDWEETFAQQTAVVKKLKADVDSFRANHKKESSSLKDKIVDYEMFAVSKQKEKDEFELKMNAAKSEYFALRKEIDEINEKKKKGVLGFF